jgi:hypothetical protein
VGQRQHLLAAIVRMGVGLARRPVRRPAGGR